MRELQMKAASAFLLAFVLSFLATPVMRSVALRFGILDQPGANRRVHRKAIPFLGGGAIFLAVVVSGLFLFPMHRESIGVFLGGTIIFLTGLLDDIFDLKAKVKFGIEILAAILVCYFGIGIDLLSNPFAGGVIRLSVWISTILTVFWIVGVTNTVNLIDGLDGLSSGVSMISALTFAFIAYRMGNSEMVVLSLVVAGACMGFLPYNFNPASIFMGDAGALFLGFMLAIISIQGVMKNSAAIALLAPILGISVPIFDTTFAIFRRWMNGQKISDADRGHLHHRLLDRGYSQRKAVIILYSVSAFYGILAILLSNIRAKYSFYVAAGILLLTVLGAWKLGIFKKKDGGGE